jgi:nicotinamidase-related amidase
MGTSLLLSKKDTALLVIDVQDKLMPVIPYFDGMVDNITRLILTFQMFRMPVVVTEQYPKGLGPTVERLRKLFTLLEVVDKLELSATDNQRFWSHVNPLKATTFVVCGVETHICVCQTVIKLIEKGMQVHVVADAVGSRHPLDHNLALRKMESAGALIATTEMCMFELAENAGTDAFKNIQRMVKGKPSPTATAPRKPAPPGAGPLDAEKTSLLSEETKAEETVEQSRELSDKQSGAAAETAVEMTPPEKTPLAPETAPSSGTDTAAPSVQALLQSIEKEVDGALKNTDKSELEIMRDMGEIDKLIGTIGNKNIDGKQ